MQHAGLARIPAAGPQEGREEAAGATRGRVLCGHTAGPRRTLAGSEPGGRYPGHPPPEQSVPGEETSVGGQDQPAVVIPYVIVPDSPSLPEANQDVGTTMEETSPRAVAMAVGDEDIPNDEHDNPHDGQDNDVYKEPLTQARVQLLQDEVNLVLNECEHPSIKNCLLPNRSSFLVLRFQE